MGFSIVSLLRKKRTEFSECGFYGVLDITITFKCLSECCAHLEKMEIKMRNRDLVSCDTLILK